MLRINLLPSYVAQRRLTRRLILLFTSIFAVVVVALLAFQFLYLQPAVGRETQLAQEAVDAKNTIDQENALAQTTLSTVAPIQAKLDFVHSVEKYNTAYNNLYLNVARYTSPAILYTGMSVSGTTMTINAFAPSIDALGKYLQIMYREPDFNSVSISAIPGPTTAGQKIYKYKGNVIGVEGGTVSASGQTQNIPGIPNGVSVPNFPTGGKTPGLGGVQAPGGPSPAPGQVPNTFPGAGGTGGGSVYQTLANEPDFNPKYFSVQIRKTDSFPFTVTATLKSALAPPAPPGAAGATPAPGGESSPGGPGGRGIPGGA